MTVINSTEFRNHQDKYLEMALNERIFIRKDNNMFSITATNDYDETDEGIELLALAKSQMFEEEDEDDFTADLIVAEERLNGDFTSADEFINYLRR